MFFVTSGFIFLNYERPYIFLGPWIVWVCHGVVHREGRGVWGRYCFLYYTFESIKTFLWFVNLRRFFLRLRPGCWWNCCWQDTTLALSAYSGRTDVTSTLTLRALHGLLGLGPSTERRGIISWNADRVNNGHFVQPLRTANQFIIHLR